MNSDRMKIILERALDWISVHVYEAGDLKRILHDELGMSDAELDEFGITFDDEEDE